VSRAHGVREAPRQTHAARAPHEACGIGRATRAAVRIVPPERGVMIPINSCATCRIGSACGVAAGGQCVMVDRRRAAGASIYVAGEVADKVWFVKHGTVLLSRDADEGGASNGVAWAVRRAGSLVGIEALVRSTYLDTARAITDVTLCVAGREQVDAWLRGREPAARAVLDCVLLAQCADVPRRAGADGNARQRVAAWLLDQPGDARFGPTAGLPRVVIAGLLGMLPETLSRALASLAKSGALAVTRKRVEIRDVGALAEIAEGHHHADGGPAADLPGS
jgi:CRP/FNR family transcriptional regulator